MKPYYQSGGITIYHGDCREILPTLPKADLLLTDPPYGIKYCPARKPRLESTSLHSSYSRQPFNRAMQGDHGPFDPSPLLEFQQVILWGANHYASRLPDSGGWLVWDKKRGGTVARHFVGSDAELAWTNLGNTVSIFQYLWHGLCRDGEQTKHYHPTQKPIALMSWALGKSNNFDTVLDPYMGSGPTLIASTRLGKSAIGIEIEEKYCEIAAKRLQQEVLDFNQSPHTPVANGGLVGTDELFK